MEGFSTNKRLRTSFLPYVRTEEPVIELAYKVVSEKEDTTIHLEVGMECLDILEPVRSSGIIESTSVEYRFQPLEFRVTDHWPDWRNKGVNMFWVEFSSLDPGFSVVVDDLHVH